MERSDDLACPLELVVQPLRPFKGFRLEELRQAIGDLLGNSSRLAVRLGHLHRRVLLRSNGIAELRRSEVDDAQLRRIEYLRILQRG